MDPVDCCPVCGGEGTFDIAHKEHELGVELRVYSCNDCNTVYHNQRMSQTSMAEYYSSGKYRSQPERKIEEARVMERIGQNISLIDGSARAKPRRCLDVGCSRGYLSKALHEKYGSEVIGYDIYKDPEAVIEVVNSKDQITGKFDLITCIHVLEHFYEPMKELTWMASLLEDDGMLMIEIPLARVVTLPHPVVFSRESVPLLMEHIGADYIFIDMQISHLGFIFAWKKNDEAEAVL